MSKHTLFVCQSCHRSSEERPKNQPADGDRFLFYPSELFIQGLQKAYSLKAESVEQDNVALLRLVDP